VKHFDLAKHLTAEEQVTDYGLGGKEIIKWQRLRKENHWLDTYYMNCMIAHTNGSRIHHKPA
jgi:hypothetical protein